MLLGLGAWLLANELLSDSDAAAAAPAGEQPRLERTADCSECGGSGDAMMKPHIGPSIYIAPCDYCDGTGKVVHWLDNLLGE